MDTSLLIQKFERDLLSLERLDARNLYRNSGLPETSFVELVVIPALERIGSRWEHGAASLSQVYMSGRICEELVDELLPAAATGRNHQPRMAIAAFENYHLLGKRIVYSVIRAAGYAITDYGRMEREPLLEKIVADKTELILLSTLMLPAALHMKEFCADLRKCGHSVKVIVGGAPFRFDPHLWEEVGADAMAFSATDAVTVIRSLFPIDRTGKTS